MGQIVILGTSNAIPDANHENTHLAILQGERKVLVDSAGSPVVRLQQAGIDPVSLTDIIATHFHPDHMSGIPILLMDMWLMGRKEPLRIHGLSFTIDRLEKMMDLYEWQRWPGFFRVDYHRLPEEELTTVISEPGLCIRSTPVKHLLPTIGLRIDFQEERKVAAYSCDTEPSPVVVRLAEGADVLIHEATGDSIGHTSPAQAGQIAREAGVKSLYLIHYVPPPKGTPLKELIAQASTEFSGEVRVAEDFMRIDL
jgi:ribonuclease Z